MIIYDCEIEKAIPGKEPRQPGVEYCGGWRDFENMGIACICAYDVGRRRSHVFCRDNLAAFQVLVDRGHVVVGFNALAFDNRLCAANGTVVPEHRTFDLLVAIWEAAGLGPEFVWPSHLGFGLDACCQASFSESKSGHGAMAPVDWQAGRVGSVIDYCLHDVWLTDRLLGVIIAGGGMLPDPRTHPVGAGVRGEMLHVDVPFWVRKDIFRVY